MSNKPQEDDEYAVTGNTAVNKSQSKEPERTVVDTSKTQSQSKPQNNKTEDPDFNIDFKPVAT